jgi:hypothetical protein
MPADGKPEEGRAVTEAPGLHARLRERVASFADGELYGAGRREIEEHLRSCNSCRQELALQLTLSRALSLEPTPGASAALRRRIEWMGEPPAPFPRGRAWAGPATAALVVLAAVGGATLVGHRGEATRPVAEIPVVRDALADCRRAMARNFPRAADVPAVSQGLHFPVHPLDRPGMELFSTWKTTIAGSPAAGLAYRWRGIVVVQYAVPTELIHQEPGVQEALVRNGYYARTELGQGVIAILKDGSGTLLVADAPPEELRRLVL